MVIMSIHPHNIGTQFDSLRDGLPDEDDQEHFMEGQCHSLACEIHRRTGWPLAAHYSSQYHAESGNEGPYHVAAVHPSGQLVDATGSYGEEDASWLHGWDDSETLIIDPDQVAELSKTAGYPEMDTDAARRAADVLITRKEE